MGALMVFIPALIAFVVYMFVASRPVGWWEGEFKEGGSGRLSASKD